MVDYDDIADYLRAQWNATNAGIVLPEIYEGDVLNPRVGFPQILVRINKLADLEIIACNLSAYFVNTPFEVEVIGANEADIIKLVNEVSRIISAKTMAGGAWIPRDWFPTNREKVRSRVIACIEKKFKLANAVAT